MWIFHRCRMASGSGFSASQGLWRWHEGELHRAVLGGRGALEALRQRCGGWVKPRIVFFGEPLPSRFMQLRDADRLGVGAKPSCLGADQERSNGPGTRQERGPASGD